MDDADYAEKYAQAYGDDKPVRMLKQLVDARHVDGKSGWTLGTGAGGSPATLGASAGGFCFPTHWSEVNYSLTGLAGTGATDWFIGPEAGVRIQTPTRVAPFVGAGGFLGINRFYENADRDGIDNDDNGFVDEPGEQEKSYKTFAAVYPEAGIHAWLNGTTRLTASGRYYVTEEGRDDDFWYAGVSLSWVISNDHGSNDHGSDG
ncbi:MAG: hypothetical protein VB858_18650 [Planctomycetaceae bacterium]